MAMLAYKTAEQNWGATGQDAGALRSHTFLECTLFTGDEEMKMPVQTCTLVGELKEVLAAQLGYIETISFSLVEKRGSFYRTMRDEDQVARRMRVQGVKSFKLPRHKYDHPHGIIGCGYTGLKLALWITTQGGADYVMFDRYDRVGGHTWLEMANKTTKLQTEFPTYHVWYGSEWSMPGIQKCGGAPVDWEIWPSRDKIKDHFNLMAEEYGILPHCHLNTNVTTMDMVGKVSDRDRYYHLTIQPVRFERKDKQGGGALNHQLGGKEDKFKDVTEGHQGTPDPDKPTFTQNVSTLAMWPGALVYPRPVVYKGEENFGGPMDYAVEMRFDYSHVPGKVVCIIGHGAFTMENIRTCLENRMKHIYVLCRKVNLTCPRPASWFVNQSSPPMSAAQLLDMLSVAYKMVKVDGQHQDPWEVHSVMSNAARTHGTIMQKTRFGIGDVYFLSQQYGLLNIITGNVKRCTYHTLHLEDGQKIECEVVLKCTGCLGDWKVDKLLKIKEMRGNYVNGDGRRVCSGEADGINASQFSLTTGGPGYYSMIKSIVHFWDVPNDWHRLLDLGILDQLPVHKAGEPNEEFPAYFFTAAHAQSAGVVISSASPLLAQRCANDDAYKNYIQMLCIPTERIIREAKADWEDYEKKFRDNNMVPADTPYVPYPYTVAYMEEQFEVHRAYVKKRYGVGA